MKKEFLIFSKKHIALYVTTVVILILPLLALIAIFTDFFSDASKIKDFSAWGSIVAGIFTYIGATVLGIVSYYNTWLNQYRMERLDYSINSVVFYNGNLKNFFDLEDFPSEEKKYYYELREKNGECFEEKLYKFKRLIINNFNSTYPMNIQIIKAELSIDGASFSDCTHDIGIVTSFDFLNSIEYKRNNVLLIGVNKELLKYRLDADNWHSYSLNLFFKMSNSRRDEICKFSIINNDSESITEILSNKESKQIECNVEIHHHL